MLYNITKNNLKFRKLKENELQSAKILLWLSVVTQSVADHESTEERWPESSFKEVEEKEVQETSSN